MSLSQRIEDLPNLEEALAAGPGRRLAAIPVTTLTTGHSSRILVHVIKGRHDGPRVAVVIGTHGGETFVSELFRVFLSNLVAGEVSGTLMVVPTANLTAVGADSTTTPSDSMNLNRAFPGRPNGSHTEMIAHAISTSILPHADWVFDYHCPSFKVRANRYTYTVDASTDYGKSIHELAIASGAPVLYLGARVPGSLMEHCKSLQIPTFVPEVGGSPVLDASYMAIGLKELTNALRYLKVLPGEVERSGPQMLFTHSEHIRPRHGGLFVSEFSLDDLHASVEGQPILGRVYDPSTFELLEEVRSPYERYVLMSVRVLSFVQPGDLGFQVGDLDTAHAVS